VELLLIRHGLPLRVENDDGAPADPPLSEEGRDQARRLAAWLVDERIDGIYSSPMQRARETAEPLAERLGLEITIEPGIAEMDADSDTYLPLEELKGKDYERWKAFVDGGYASEHDFRLFHAEVVGGIEGIIAANPGRRVAVFCHGGVINSWAAHTLGLAPKLFVDAIYTSVNRFIAAGTGERSLASLNEVAHLRGDAPGNSGMG
jgi:probable phosphoglycerate mutase